ncbi:hypothetical protein [Pseudomonas sp. SWRI92]|uniref:hypothetical protein n=1 Tax=Pseudomonas sp. SWRI92 TaxID=2745499 RepID=UPI001EE2DEEF|nr:hypothetical protein [Pseudomonas sp. SWRI92]
MVVLATGPRAFFVCKSLVTYPSGTQKLTRKGLHEMRGIAWSGHGKITRVDVSIDGNGNTWLLSCPSRPSGTNTCDDRRRCRGLHKNHQGHYSSHLREGLISHHHMPRRSSIRRHDCCVSRARKRVLNLFFIRPSLCFFTHFEA